MRQYPKNNSRLGHLRALFTHIALHCAFFFAKILKGNEAGCIYAVLCIIVSVIISKEYERMPVLAVYTIFNLVLNIVNCYKIMSYSLKYSPLIGAPSFLNIHKSNFYFLCETKISIRVMDASSISFTIPSIFDTM